MQTTSAALTLSIKHKPRRPEAFTPPDISSPSGQELTQQRPNAGCFLFIHSDSFSLMALSFQESHSSLLNYPPGTEHWLLCGVGNPTAVRALNTSLVMPGSLGDCFGMTSPCSGFLLSYFNKTRQNTRLLRFEAALLLHWREQMAIQARESTLPRLPSESRERVN